MTALHALRPDAATPSQRTSSPPSAPDAQMRAAEIMGRIIHLFDGLASCAAQELEKARGLLVDELAQARSVGTRAPHQSRRRNAVLTAALECVHVASQRESERPLPAASAWSPRGGNVLANSESTSLDGERVLDRVHRVLDGVVALQDPPSSSRRPRGVDVLAHMLRGPEPRSWSRDQQAFARCALEWMRARIDEPSPDGPAEPGRWSTSPRRTAGKGPGRRDSAGRLLSA
jgi:hypothetical protein